jgi:GTP-binding protein
MANVVAIVGRPNVGKSTFFNRMVEKRQAIMNDMPGVTRDRHYGYAEWCGRFFTVIDTGGYVTGSEDKFESEIRKQVELAIDEASAIIFMVDTKDGVTGFDKDFANVLRTTKKPVFIAANKTDTPDKTPFIAEFYELGLGEVYPVSAENGSGTVRKGTLIKTEREGEPEAKAPLALSFRINKKASQQRPKQTWQTGNANLIFALFGPTNGVHLK